MADFVFSKRTDWSLNHNPLTLAVDQLRFQGVELLDLTESNPTKCAFDYPLGWLTPLCDQANLLYAPQDKGLLAARMAIAAYYAQKKIIVDPGHCVLTSSTSEAYSFLLKLLTNPGDRVLIPSPSYPLFQFLLELHDVVFDYYPLEYDGSWRIDRKAFNKMLTANTRAVIVVNPNNPTASYLSEDDLAFLNETCLKHKMSIICDEVFLDYQLDKKTSPISLAGNSQVPTFVLSGISKILGLPQMKLSWIAVNGPEAFRQQALERLEIISDTYLSVNTPVQNALGTWLIDAPHIQKQILQRVEDNLEFLDQHNLNILSSQGGWYAVIRMPGVCEEEFVLNLLQEDHVLAHPGYFFDFQEEGYLIVSLLPESQIFRQAIERIARRIKN